ncbi:micrococcal nuclease [Alteribacillus persepolensis]|uniref:Micrococcal nuclease n=1 Tax=Alteribacillus persepolensis TaxID=568899 RepID=A0A1G8JIJ1_9BACI|nr:thermonuclease family protein [Alteribacillus persepolensis]SDI30976.1 micrococcal nuclease [Alteribacillus persepolensis]
MLPLLEVSMKTQKSRTTRLVYIFFLLLFLTLSACSQDTAPVDTKQSQQTVDTHTETEESPDGSDIQTIEATVTEVVDGDTIKVQMNGNEETVRLLLVDTPETVHPNKPKQPYGEQASQFAKKHLPTGENVTIEIDTTIRDHYDRFLAYIWIQDNMFNEMLLAEGLARVAYVIEPNTRYVEHFRQVEQQAKEQQKGIWSHHGYVTDDGFHPDAVTNPTNEANKNADTAVSCDEPAIKGNHSSSGDLIYHKPGQQHYEQTKAEEMFCTEQEAQDAGYRPSQR